MEVKLITDYDSTDFEIKVNKVLNGVEVGSYLMREVEFEGKKIMYTCGTGLAEPRFETAMFYGVKL